MPFQISQQSYSSIVPDGYDCLYVDSTTGALTVMNSASYHRGLGINNYSVASQAPAATTRTYITGSALTFAAGQLQIGTAFRWTFDVTKTGAGTASATVDIAFGTAGTTADTARVSFTKPAGTAVIDCGKFVIEAIVRGPIGGAGVVAGHMTLTHNLQTTGLANVPCVDVTTISAAFDVTTPTYVGVCITTGASDAYTMQLVMAEAWNI